MRPTHVSVIKPVLRRETNDLVHFTYYQKGAERAVRGIPEGKFPPVQDPSNNTVHFDSSNHVSLHMRSILTDVVLEVRFHARVRRERTGFESQPWRNFLIVYSTSSRISTRIGIST